jgi:uncharacterized membrane protein
MKEPNNKSTGPTVPPERLKALADGVFAIVMTLLVLELGVPVIAETSAHKGLAQGLLEMWPKFLIYGLSFLILGIFWLIHHIIFDAIKRYDTTLIWLNILFLMFVALIPFSTSLFGEHGADRVTALVYGVNMLLIFNMGWALWSYASAKHRLVDSDLGPDLVKGGKVMGLIYTLIMLPAIVISFFTPVISFFIYGLMVLVIILATVLGKTEMVTIWPVTRKSGGGEYTRQH